MATYEGLVYLRRRIDWLTVARALLTFAAAVVYGPAYAAAATIRHLRSASAFVAVTAKLGWTDGRTGRRGPA